MALDTLLVSRASVCARQVQAYWVTVLSIKLQQRTAYLISAHSSYTTCDLTFDIKIFQFLPRDATHPRY